MKRIGFDNQKVITSTGFFLGTLYKAPDEWAYVPSSSASYSHKAKDLQAILKEIQKRNKENPNDRD